MQKLYQGFIRLEAILAGAFLLVMVAMIFTGGVARLSRMPLNWTIDIATCAFAWAAFLCADIAWRKDLFMSIDALVTRFSPSFQRLMMLINYLLIAAFLVYLIYSGFQLTWTSRARSFQGIPGVSYSWVTASLPVGATLMLITTIIKMRRDLGPNAASTKGARP
ncbi:TRAP transporter small permease [Peteryoungia desertarenae]|uniref:TRAP transporter small permease protein n=1 Tax=Peteryoungia desertarenae TaxID=1813451 RepID=A0ABX6QQR3_9HYPH|nr:TRAP transporter small permease [Peteryoungia desertarenae]QLF70547.1 TRAP transporter small permease [Peteryoungia desertarenae]